MNLPDSLRPIALVGAAAVFDTVPDRFNFALCKSDEVGRALEDCMGHDAAYVLVRCRSDLCCDGFFRRILHDSAFCTMSTAAGVFAFFIGRFVLHRDEPRGSKQLLQTRHILKRLFSLSI